MEPEELKKTAEEARGKGEKAVGLTTAIVAVLLASATLLGHRAHTEEIKLQTKVNDGWAFYQAKHTRAHEYGIAAGNHLLMNDHDDAVTDLKLSIDEECGSPAPKGCTSPLVKNYPAIKKLAGELSPASPNESKNNSHPPATEANKETPSSAEGSQAKKDVPALAVKEGAVQVYEHTQHLEKETELMATKADRFDSAELFLEVSIVLCSIALLADERRYWKLSFVTTALGIGLAMWGFILHYA